MNSLQVLAAIAPTAIEWDLFIFITFLNSYQKTFISDALFKSSIFNGVSRGLYPTASIVKRTYPIKTPTIAVFSLKSPQF